MNQFVSFLLHYCLVARGLVYFQRTFFQKSSEEKANQLADQFISQVPRKNNILIGNQQWTLTRRKHTEMDTVLCKKYLCIGEKMHVIQLPKKNACD